ncbi:Cro/CI family transcriptional regulator [Aeromonas veronii]|uniref:Cro/CI family transcriptional regulator n=1 Tax=Aeromonas veronii TaxID=654 RepID=UPI003B9E417E
MKTELAVDYFGTKAAIADALGIKRSAVSQWGETIPQGRAYQIEVLTDGKLKADSRSIPQQPTPCV